MTIDIPPNDISSTHMEVTIPADLQPGSYNLSVTKAGDFGEELSSTGIHFLVTPSVLIHNTDCEEQHAVTIKGTGFGHYLDAEDSGTTLLASGKKCTVDFWSDNTIIANCPDLTTGSIQLFSLFGSTSAEIKCRPEAPKWWSIWSWWSSWSWARR